ncbi:MAG: putative damage-inducible protein DinB [Bacteroidia bacterium]|jgi:uncharacterized damage-inducible protein DinB
MNTTDPRFPIGKFQFPTNMSPHDREHWIEVIASFPKRVENSIAALTDEECKTWEYRSGGWSIHQVVHHCSDSHMNGFIRFKLGLTEDVPTIKPYAEALWAEMPDVMNEPLTAAIKLLEIIHRRWVILLKSMSEEDYKRELIHPEHQGSLQLESYLSLYAWHCNHHFAHIEQAIALKNAFEAS